MSTTGDLGGALAALRSGIGSGDAIKALLSAWSACLGRTVGEEDRQSESIRLGCDLSSIHLRGMGLVPVLFLGNDGPPLRGAVAKFLDEAVSGGSVRVLACLTDSALEYVRWRTSSRPDYRVILSHGDIRRMLLDPDPLKQFRRQVLHQNSFRSLIPFTPTNPAQGAMFFGRESEVAMLVEEDDVDYALCGPGGIGKTSLLRQMQWVLGMKRHARLGRIVEIDLLATQVSEHAAAREIAQRVSHTRFAHYFDRVDDLHSFFRRARAIPQFADGPIDLIIDECDSILAHDRRIGYPLLTALRHAKNQKLIRVTFSGREETRAIMADAENPFHRRMKLLEVRPLPADTARDLLTRPLEHLGVQIHDPTAKLDRLLSQCEGVPARIQDCGLAIANRAALDHSQPVSINDCDGLRGAQCA